MNHVPDSDPFTSRQLTNKLTEFGVTLTPSERKHFLTLTSRTVIKKLKALATGPVVSQPIAAAPEIQLGDVIDGLTSSKTYHVLARRGDALVTARHLNDSVKVKFHPSMRAWALDHEAISQLGGTSFVDRGDDQSPIHRHYQRMYIAHAAFPHLMERLRRVPKGVTLDNNNVILALEGKPLVHTLEAAIVKPRIKHVEKPKLVPKPKLPPKPVPKAGILKKRPSKAQFDEQ